MTDSQNQTSILLDFSDSENPGEVIISDDMSDQS